MNEHSITFKLDTGAEVTAISTDTYKTLRKPRLSPPKKLLYGPSRQPLDTAGQFQAEITYKDKREQQPVYVVKGLKTNLLELPAITALGLYSRPCRCNYWSQSQDRDPGQVSWSLPRSRKPRRGVRNLPQTGCKAVFTLHTPTCTTTTTPEGPRRAQPNGIDRSYLQSG